jgi:hypothetical protein
MAERYVRRKTLQPIRRRGCPQKADFLLGNATSPGGYNRAGSVVCAGNDKGPADQTERLCRDARWRPRLSRPGCAASSIRSDVYG